MTSQESNKIFAAILVAGITLMMGGFVANVLIHPHELEEDAVFIDGGAVAGAGGESAAAMPDPILDLIATADIAQGQKLSKACAACHSFDQGGAAKIGPNLWGIVGNKHGHMEGFAYSEAMLAKGGQWTYEELNHFLWKPKAYIPGTKMNFIGMKKPQDRADIIAWLRTLGSDSIPLPNEAAIAAEKAELAPPSEEGSQATENAEVSNEGALDDTDRGTAGTEEGNETAGDSVPADNVNEQSAASDNTSSDMNNAADKADTAAELEDEKISPVLNEEIGQPQDPQEPETDKALNDTNKSVETDSEDEIEPNTKEENLDEEPYN